MKSNKKAVKAKKVPEAFIRILQAMVDKKFCRPNGFTLKEAQQNVGKPSKLSIAVITVFLLLTVIIGVQMSLKPSLLSEVLPSVPFAVKIIYLVAVFVFGCVLDSISRKFIEPPKDQQEVCTLLKEIERYLKCIYEKYPFLEEASETEAFLVRQIEFQTRKIVDEINELQVQDPEWKRRVYDVGVESEQLDKLDDLYFHLSWMVGVIIRLELMDTGEDNLGVIVDIKERYRVRTLYVYEKLFASRGSTYLSSV